MSDTPRTDAKRAELLADASADDRARFTLMAYHAMQLERELAARPEGGAQLDELDRRLSELANTIAGGDGTQSYYLHGLWRAREEIKKLKEKE